MISSGCCDKGKGIEGAGPDVVQYLTHSILIPPVLYMGPRWDRLLSGKNGAAPSNISPKNGQIGPELDNLYNLGMFSFQNIKSKVAHLNPKFTAALGLSHEIAHFLLINNCLLG